MKFSFFLAALLLCKALLFASSVVIYNDSPFPLHAEIVSADGVSRGKVQVAPQQQITWRDTTGYQAVWSQTPYTVIFTCASGKVYGVYSGVSAGALATPQSSTGDRYCEPKKKGEQDRQQGQQQAPSTTPPLSPEHLKTDPIWGPP